MDRQPALERQRSEPLTLQAAAYPCLAPIVAHTPEATFLGRLPLDPLPPNELELVPGFDGTTSYGELVQKTPAYRNIDAFLDYLVWWDQPLRSPDAPVEGGCLVISPHPDDSEFSMGGWLVKHRDRRNVTHAVCFSHVAYTQFPEAFPSACEASAVRRSESRLAASMLGLHNVDFEFPDFEIRMREPEELFAMREQELQKLLKIELYRLIANTRPAEIFAPAAIGNHPDHRLVFDIILDFFDAQRFPETKLHFYEDVPYSASYYEVDSFLARFETSYITVRPWTEEISSVLDLKTALCEVYRSQAVPGLLGTIENIARRTGEFLDPQPEAAAPRAAERFWTLEESLLLVD